MSVHQSCKSDEIADIIASGDTLESDFHFSISQTIDSNFC